VTAPPTGRDASASAERTSTSGIGLGDPIGFAGDLLAGRSAVVTGGASGIGLATAALLARCGARVRLTDRDAAGVQAAASRLGSSVEAVTLDVTDLQAIRSFANRLADTDGGLDILVNAAGAFERNPVGSTDSLQAWRRMRAVNADSVFFMCHTLGPLLRGRTASCVVNVASVRARTAARDACAYSVSKAMVVQLTRAFALEWAAHSVRVNAVAPGDIETPMNPRIADDSQQSALLARTPMGRMGQPGEIAKVIAFLASPLSSYVTGSTVDVDGGFMAN